MVKINYNLSTKFIIGSSLIILINLSFIIGFQVFFFNKSNLENLMLVKKDFNRQIENNKSVFEKSLRAKGKSLLSFLSQLGAEKVLYFDHESLARFSEEVKTDVDVYNAAYYDKDGFPIIPLKEIPKINVIELSTDMKDPNSSESIGSVKIWMSTLSLNQNLKNSQKRVEKSLKSLESHYNHQKKNQISVTVVLMLIGIALLCVSMYFAVRFLIIKPILDIKHMADNMASGMLGLNLDIDRTDEIGELGRSMVRTVESFQINQKKIEKSVTDLQQILKEVDAASDEIAAESNQISESTNFLSEGAANQQISLNEITNSMNEIGKKIDQNAENATQANEVSQAAKVVAQNGSQQMEGLMDAMSEIDQSSQEISKIITAIDDIASETTLLALNAAMEAARAGKYGSGFAIIADEVKKLSERSATAAKETIAIVKESNQRTDRGLRSAVETNEMLNEIVVSVNQVTAFAGKIANASGEQSKAIAVVNKGLEQVGRVTHQNTAFADKTASSAKDLSMQSVRLENILNKYRKL